MKEVNPKETTRAYAFEMWMNAPMPMLTFFKTVDVTRLVRISDRTGLKFNMLMCWCVGKAASDIKEFYMLPVGKKLMQYDNLAVCTIVANRKGEVSSCDVPFSDNLQQFNADYLRLTKQVAESCQNHDLTDSMVIGTSALAQYEIDGAVGAFVEAYIDCLFSVPPYTDGRCTCCMLLGKSAKRNWELGSIIKNSTCWRKRPFDSTTPQYRPTSRRLTFISSSKLLN